MKGKAFPIVVVVETAILGFAAMGVFGVLMDQYERAHDAIAEQTAVVRATEVYIAMVSSTPPTATATNTRTPTRTATPTRTPTPTATPTPTLPPTPTSPPTPTAPPPPTASRPPTAPPTSPPPTFPAGPTLPSAATLPPTPRPTEAGTPVPWKTLSQCDDIESAGFYRLGADLVANGECIKVKASGVVLDCLKHTIRGTNFSGYGIAIRRYGLLNLQTPAYVEVRNCRVSNFHDGIYVEAGDHLVIRDNDSSNNYDDTDPVTRFGKFLGMTEGSGIRLNNTTNSQVLNNVTLHQAIGIDVRSSSGVSVRGNTSSDNSAWGINFVRTQNSEASSNTTTDNVRKCTWGAGTVGFGCDAGGIVVQDGSSGNVIANNSVTGRNGNGIFIKAHALPCGNNNSIVGNTITSVLYNAVELGFCTGNKINNNQIRDGLDGVWLGFAHDTEINGNTIVNMRNHGIISSNSHGNTVSGNQVINSNEGLYFYSEDYDRGFFSFLPPGDYRSYGNCLCGNTFQSNAIAVHLLDSTSNQVTGNVFISNARTFLVQGNGDGNNLQGFDGWRLPTWGTSEGVLSLRGAFFATQQSPRGLGIASRSLH